MTLVKTSDIEYYVVTPQLLQQRRGAAVALFVPTMYVCYSESERREEAKKRLEKRLEKRENT